MFIPQRNTHYDQITVHPEREYLIQSEIDRFAMRDATHIVVTDQEMRVTFERDCDARKIANSMLDTGVKFTYQFVKK